MSELEEVANHFQSLYGFNIVKVDSLTQFQRNVTLITIEVPNELLEQALFIRSLSTRLLMRYQRARIQ